VKSPGCRRRLDLLRLTTSRWTRRRQPVRRAVVVVERIAQAVVVVGLVALVLGIVHWTVAIVVALAGIVALACACLRLFPVALAISVMGVALACSSLTTALAVTSGVEAEIVGVLARLNGHAQIGKYGLDFTEYRPIAERWRNDARVTAVAPFAFATATIVAEREDDDPRGGSPGAIVVAAKGIDPKDAVHFDGLAQLLARKDLAALRPGDAAYVPGIVLGVALARALDVSVGQHVRVVVPAEIDGTADAVRKPPRFARFEVLDTFETGTWEFDRHWLLMHLTAAQALFFREGRVSGIEVQIADADDVDALIEDMQAELPTPPYRFTTWRESNDATLATLDQIRGVLAVVLGLEIVVGASSIVVSLMLLIRRKRRDIAILMGLGADGSFIFSVFESIGVLIGTLGAALGTVLSGLFCSLVALVRFPLGAEVHLIDHLPVALRLADFIGPVLAAIVLCALASGPAAIVATRVRVVGELAG
jgi:lipoprotein-releasing system permease protein